MRVDNVIDIPYNPCMATFRELVLERCEGMSLAEMAELLQVTVGYCSFLRTGRRGKRHLSRRVSQRALQLWPSLTDAYLRELLAEGADPENAAAKESARASVV